jgi:catechol 2,3-dioxygenase-like lactoylglutathione lyase family enzyme
VIDHCVIAVSDWERSNAFYREVIGAQVIQRGPGFGAAGAGASVYFRDPDGSLMEFISYERARA